MEFEWDAIKSKANLEKHEIGFEQARDVFDGAVFTRVDDRQDYGEARSISLGVALFPATVLIVAHTERGNTTRLISARRANRRERKVYYDHLEKAKRST